VCFSHRFIDYASDLPETFSIDFQAADNL